MGRTFRRTGSRVLAVTGSVVILFATSCTSSGDRPAAPGDSVQQTQVVQPTGSSSESSEEQPEVASSGPDLYRVDPATGEADLILAAADGLHDPERSPDGSRLVYQGSSPNGTEQIFVLDRDRRRQLTHLPVGALEPTWSPDGTQIAFAGLARGGDTDIFVMDADGTHIRRLMRTEGSDHNPDWSPDGSRIVFDDFPNILVAPVRGGEVTTLTSTSSITSRHGPAADPTWSPDGRWIAFTRFAPGSVNGIIPYASPWAMSADGIRERRLTQRRQWNHSYLSPSWAPDGSSIVVSVLDEPRGELGIIDVRSSRVSYLDTSQPMRDLSWSNEGIIGCGESYDQPLWSSS